MRAYEGPLVNESYFSESDSEKCRGGGRGRLLVPSPDAGTQHQFTIPITPQHTSKTRSSCCQKLPSPSLAVLSSVSKHVHVRGLVLRCQPGRYHIYHQPSFRPFLLAVTADCNRAGCCIVLFIPRLHGHPFPDPLSLRLSAVTAPAWQVV